MKNSVEEVLEKVGYEKGVKKKSPKKKITRKKGDEEFEGKEAPKMLKESYDNINQILDYYMDLPEETKNVVSLWIIGTHFHPHFSTYPYLFVNAMRGSGKTRLLKIIAALSNEGNWTMSLTESVMFRSKGTLAIDEFEGIGSKDKTSLRELLNAGYKKGMKIFRMAKKKSSDGETQVVEEFEPFRPITLANIWGMEEVLGDRCINILLEKSIDPLKIKIIEDFEDLEIINYTKKMLNYVERCSLCSVVTEKNIKQKWNSFVKQKYIDNTTPTTLTTYNTYNYTNYTKEDTLFFNKINETEIEGRHLELFFPLFMISQEMGDEVLENTIAYAKRLVNEKKIEEITESKDVLVYSVVAKENPNDWRDIKNLAAILKLMIGEEVDWINSRWMGRALKRLNLVKEKRRVGKGIQVLLNVEKAKLKEKIFKPEVKEEVEEETKEISKSPKEMEGGEDDNSN